MTQTEAMNLFSAFYRITDDDIAQFLSADEHKSFRFNPVRFFYAQADDALKDRIWNLVEAKMPKRKQLLAAE